MFDGLVDSVVDFKRDLNTGLLLTELVRLRNLSTNFALSCV